MVQWLQDKFIGNWNDMQRAKNLIVWKVQYAYLVQTQHL
jgi:hypothetical protein